MPGRGWEMGGHPKIWRPSPPNCVPSPEGSGRLRKRQCCSRMNGPDSLMSTSTWPTLERGTGKIGAGLGRGPERVWGCHSPPSPGHTVLDVVQQALGHQRVLVEVHQVRGLLGEGRRNKNRVGVGEGVPFTGGPH